MKSFGLKRWIFNLVAVIPAVILGCLYDRGNAYWWIVGVGAWANVVGYLEGMRYRPGKT